MVVVKGKVCTHVNHANRSWPGFSFLFSSCYSDGTAATADSPPVTSSKPPSVPPTKPKIPQAEVNYAAEKAGAVVLSSSDALIGAKNLLDDDKDKYARSPCDQSKWVIINLSEDVSSRGWVHVRISAHDCLFLRCSNSDSCPCDHFGQL